MFFMADMPVHPFLLQFTQDQVLSIAIIAPLYSSSMNDPYVVPVVQKSKEIILTLTRKLRRYTNHRISQGSAPLLPGIGLTLGSRSRPSGQQQTPPRGDNDEEKCSENGGNETDALGIKPRPGRCDTVCPCRQID